MPDILMYYEHEVREIESVILLKVELERRGYSVDVVRIGADDYDSVDFIKSKLKERPKVLVVPFMYGDNNYNSLAWFKGKLIPVEKIVNLQWEQVISKAWDENGFHYPSGIAQYANHVCWGEESNRQLISKGIDPVKAPVCGAVQLDFLRERFRSFYKSKHELAAEFNIDVNKKWILYISSFTLSNESDEKIKNASRMVGDSTNLFGRMAQSMYDSKIKTLEFIESLINKDKECIFIYRPHPGENNDEIRKFAEKYPNRFIVISEYSVKQWIVACDFINTWISTSIIEAYFANKMCNIIRPTKVPDDIEPFIYEDSIKIIDEETFISSNQMKTDYKENDFPIAKEKINSYYSVSSNNYTYEKIADLIEKVMKNEEDGKKQYKPKYYLRLVVKYLEYIYKLINEKNILTLSRILPFKEDVLKRIEQQVVVDRVKGVPSIRTRRKIIKKWEKQIELTLKEIMGHATSYSKEKQE